MKNIATATISRFIVTGKDRTGKRFKLSYNSLLAACMVNIYNGSVWVETDNGKRTLIKRVTN